MKDAKIEREDCIYAQVIVVAERGVTRIGNVMIEMICDDEWERVNCRRGIIGKEFLDDCGVQVKTDKLGKE